MWGQGAFGQLDKPTNFIPGHRFISTSIGGTSGVALDEFGIIYAWGNNTNGELGMGDMENRNQPSIIVAL